MHVIDIHFLAEVLIWGKRVNLTPLGTPNELGRLETVSLLIRKLLHCQKVLRCLVLLLLSPLYR